MRTINPGRYCPKVNDKLDYNPKAIDWIIENGYLGSTPIPSTEELNKRDPIAIKVRIDRSFKKYVLELWVQNNKYTGISGFIVGGNIDVWFLNQDCTGFNDCPYPMFKERK